MMNVFNFCLLPCLEVKRGTPDPHIYILRALIASDALHSCFSYENCLCAFDIFLKTKQDMQLPHLFICTILRAVIDM